MEQTVLLAGTLQRVECLWCCVGEDFYYGNVAQ